MEEINVEYIHGCKEEFFDFLNSITEEDKIGIFTHNDLDGIASAIFLEEILKVKGLQKSFLNFSNYIGNMFENIKELIEKNEITKAFLLDLGEGSNFDSFKELKDNAEVFLIDHHPPDSKIYEEKNVLKSVSEDCAALIVYSLASSIADMKKWKWLMSAAIISEISYKKKSNFDFVKEKYPTIRETRILESDPGRLAIKIGSALIYFQENEALEEAYELVKKKEFKELDKVHEIVRADIDNSINEFQENVEYFSDKKFCFCIIHPKFNITSAVITKLSFIHENLDKVFVIVSEIKNEDKYKASARNQSGEIDVNELMRNAVKGLENASGGGHKKASAATFMKKDLSKFKENLLKSL